MDSQVGDEVQDLTNRAWKNSKILSRAPSAFKLLNETVLSMISSLRIISESIEERPLTRIEESLFQQLITKSDESLTGLESVFKNLRIQQVANQDFAACESELLQQVTDLSSFSLSLRRPLQEKIIKVLEQIRRIRDGERQKLMVNDWGILEIELWKSGIREELVNEEYFFIKAWLKENYPNARNGNEPEHPPDYAPGTEQASVDEKVHDLDKKTRELSINGTEASVATSARVEPPPYALEDGNDGDIDDEFAVHIQQAVDAEAERRRLERLEHPERCPQPWMWLPRSFQSPYVNSPEIISMMEPDSFSVMAYQTVPTCVDEVERLTQLIRVSYEEKQTRYDAVADEAFASLQVVSKALSKYVSIQDQYSTNNAHEVSRFSDLDVLDFEFSTAVNTEKRLQFPVQEFSFALQSCYGLLKYIMGFLAVVSTIFQGRTYVTRSHEELEIMWREKKMGARTAWIEKQIVGWAQVRNALAFCRNWHSMRPGLREQAISALKDWDKSSRILSGAEGGEHILFTVVAASNVPKSLFSQPSAWVQVVVYGTNRFGGALRMLELKTEISRATQHPVWNKEFSIYISKTTKMIDVEVYDRVAGIDKEICRCRFLFKFIPGVEASLGGHSLLHGFDQQADYPMLSSNEKGKEKDPILLRAGLKWDGRYAQADRAGLLLRPPGKMFRPDLSVVPLSPEEKDAVRFKTEARRRSSATTT